MESGERENIEAHLTLFSDINCQHFKARKSSMLNGTSSNA